MTDPIKPSKKAAGKAATEKLDDFKIAVDHSIIIELRYFGQQDALFWVGQQDTGFNAKANAAYSRVSEMSPDTADAPPCRPSARTAGKDSIAKCRTRRS